MSTQTRIRAHLVRQERKPLLPHETGMFRSLHPEEQYNDIVKGMTAMLATLGPIQRHRMLNYANMELTDMQFRRAVRIALNS